jgi:carbamoyl-phosphate synthase small subunit
MTGYQEILQNPSYYGQLMVTTNAHIGNCSVNENEVESDSIRYQVLICKILVLIILALMLQRSLEVYFKKQSLICISDVDTRGSLVKLYRKR